MTCTSTTTIISTLDTEEAKQDAVFCSGAFSLSRMVDRCDISIHTTFEHTLCTYVYVSSHCRVLPSEHQSAVKILPTSRNVVSTVFDSTKLLYLVLPRKYKGAGTCVVLRHRSFIVAVDADYLQQTGS